LIGAAFVGGVLGLHTATLLLVPIVMFLLQSLTSLPSVLRHNVHCQTARRETPERHAVGVFLSADSREACRWSILECKLDVKSEHRAGPSKGK
jgi:hypothetical protein